MAYQLSPGVAWTEIDLTTIVPPVSTTTGAFVGNFDWGPTGEVFPVANELELVRYFQRPSANTFKSFFTAANFLNYSQSLQLVRATGNTAVNSTSGTSGLLIKNKNDYETQYIDLSAANTYGMFAARYAGKIGDTLKVSLWASSNANAYAQWAYSEEFNGVPGTSPYTASRNGANDEMHIVVIDSNGKFGLAGTILEKFAFVSKASDAKLDDGSSNYWVNVLNDRSDYVYALNPAQNVITQVSDTSTWGNQAQGTNFAESSPGYTMTLKGGVDAAPTDADIIMGYDLFSNPDVTDVSLVMCGDHSQTVAEYVVDNIAGIRKDCVAFISPLMEDVVNNSGYELQSLTAYRNDFNSSSYAVMDSAWKKQFDKYNNVYRWVPLNGDIAGLCARTDYERDAWWSPAGFNRGAIKNVVTLSWNPAKADRDDLYKVGINPVVNFPGEGVILYGDKTMLNKPSAFDRINVRRLFIVLEKAITKAAKYSLFEFNDEFTRAQFVALVEPYLRDVKGRRGIYDFKVVCDETNNTPEVIDRNEFVGDIYIKPARSINFIQLNFVAVRTGVAFSEVVGKF